MRSRQLSSERRMASGSPYSHYRASGSESDCPRTPVTGAVDLFPTAQAPAVPD